MPLFLADCISRTCDWDRLVAKEETALLLETFHMVVKHPEEYEELNPGKKAEDVLRQYRDAVGAEGWTIIKRQI